MNNKNVNLLVNGMHCKSCADKIVTGVKLIQEDAKVDINLETNNVSISFDETKASVSVLKEKIIESGFSIEMISVS